MGRNWDDEDRGPRWRRGEGRRYGDEDEGPRRWHQRRFGGGDGMGPPMMGRGPMTGREGMMGRGGMMQPFGMAHFCGPNGGRMGEFMIGRIERVTQPTAEQRAGFDKLKEAIAKASETMRGACITERPVTPTGRLAAAEKRLAAMLDAVRTVRPALDAFYNSLSDEQKARLTLAQPHMGRGGMDGGGWRERMQRWRERMHRDDSRDDRTQREQPSDDEDSERL
jgi:LTXXQ motif family protein